MPHKRNQNERRAIALLSAEIGRPVRSWPGIPGLRRLMAKQLPPPCAPNDSVDLWSEDEIGGEWGLIRPDAFFLEPSARNVFRGWNPRCHHLCLVEVETTSPMSEEKVQRLGNCWDIFHFSDAWELHLIVWDIYDQWREIDLCRFYYRANWGIPAVEHGRR